MSEISRERAQEIVGKIGIEQEKLTKLGDNELRLKISNNAISPDFVTEKQSIL